MKVYLLINHFSFDGAPDEDIAVFSTREKAEKKMREDFEEYKQEYLNEYAEDQVEIEKPNEFGACLSLLGDYNEKHDEWSIVEEEVL